MKLSTTCPGCGKQFRNIKPELAGKKVRCGCGTVLRVGQLESTTPKKQELPPQPSNLLDVDLLGDEMLGDELLAGNPESLVKDEIAKRQRQGKIDVPKPSVGAHQNGIAPKSFKIAKPTPNSSSARRPSKPVDPNKPVTAQQPAGVPPKSKKKKKHRPPVPIAHPVLDGDDAPAFTSTAPL